MESTGHRVFAPSAQAPGFDRRWDKLLDMISTGRGWSEPQQREYPDAEDESNCWAMPVLPVEGHVPEDAYEEVRRGDVIVVEATWTFAGDDDAVLADVRSAAGWLPSVYVVDGRIQSLRQEAFLPTTTLGDGGLPVPIMPEESLEGGIPLMQEYEDLLARSALAGAHVFAEIYEPIAAAATEVSDGAHATSELAHLSDLPVLEPFAQQELNSTSRIRRSYVWFFQRSARDLVNQMPGSVRWDVLETAAVHLQSPRSRREVSRMPLRSYALLERAVPAAELDLPHHRFSENWRSVETVADILADDASDVPNVKERR